MSTSIVINERKKRIELNQELLSSLFYKYVKSKYCGISASLYILEDLNLPYASIFDQTLANFNVCISIRRFAFILSGKLDLILRQDINHDNSLREDVMLTWLDHFSKTFDLGENFEYLYFFNIYGDATLYLDLDSQQLIKLKTYIVEEHDSNYIPNWWSFEQVDNDFLTHMLELLQNGSKEDIGVDTLTCYGFKLVNEIVHRRSSSFNSPPLNYDSMRSFLQQSDFVDPSTRISFEYKIKAGPQVDHIKYSLWADFSYNIMVIFSEVFGFELVTRVFVTTYRKEDSIFVDFYFERELDNELFRQLISNFARGNFGIKFVPDTLVNRDLAENTIYHGVTHPSREEFINSLPTENISFYAMFDLEKRLWVRRFSYLHNYQNCIGPIPGLTTYLIDLFWENFDGLANPKKLEYWFRPIEFNENNSKSIWTQRIE